MRPSSHTEPVLLAEEMLLLGLDPAGGTVVNNARQQLLVGLGGALIGELALAGLVDLSGRRFVSLGGHPGEPLLATVHRALARPQGRRGADQLRRLDKSVGGLWSVLVDGLIEQGVLGRRRDRVLLVPVTRHPVLRAAARDEVLQRVRAAAADDGELEPRTAVVLALTGPSRLLEVVAPEKASRRHARARIQAATDLTPVAPVVKKVIAQMQAAAAAGAAAAATAASS